TTLWTVIAAESAGLGQHRLLWTFTRIDADAQQREILTKRQTDTVETADQSVLFDWTHVLAVEIVEAQDHRPLAKIAAEGDGVTHLIGEGKVQRHAAPELLVELDAGDLLRIQLMRRCGS